MCWGKEKIVSSLRFSSWNRKKMMRHATENFLPTDGRLMQNCVSMVRSLGGCLSDEYFCWFGSRPIGYIIQRDGEERTKK